MSKPRDWKPEEKVRILEEARQPGTNVSEVCRRYGITSGMFYKWESQAAAGMKQALSGSRGRPGGGGAEAELERLKQELARKNQVIAELSSALIEEKKGLSTYLFRDPPGMRRG